MNRIREINGLHVVDHGSPDAPALVLAHGLGMDVRIWAPIVPLLPDALRVVLYDARGHGRSDCPTPPYTMGRLIRDAETVLDVLDLQGSVFLGLAMGGMVAQGLAVKRLDLVRALVLCSTSTRSGTSEAWETHAALARDRGMEGIADALLPRWFARQALAEAAPWRAMLLSQNPLGYVGCCAALSGSDFYSSTSGLRLPVLGLAGTEDRINPPDMMQETIALIPGARLELMRKAGHLPCVDQPELFARHVTEFLEEIGHI